jgi:hypothetical protein
MDKNTKDNLIFHVLALAWFVTMVLIIREM